MDTKKKNPFPNHLREKVFNFFILPILNMFINKGRTYSYNCVSDMIFKMMNYLQRRGGHI